MNRRIRVFACFPRRSQVEVGELKEATISPRKKICVGGFHGNQINADTERMSRRTERIWGQLRSGMSELCTMAVAHKDVLRV